MRVLVAYVSPHGSAQEIAERIAARLRADGVSADCLPVHATRAIDGYGAYVVGSAIHDQAWMPAASGFLSDHAAELSHRPVWLFSVGMPGALARPLRRLAMREGPKVVAPFEVSIHPRDTRLFTGVVSPHQFPLLGRLAFRLMGGRFGDFRDWPAIDAWGAGIGRTLLLEESRSS